MSTRLCTPFLTTLLICAAALSISAPAASASRESRESHEARRATLQAQRDARRTARQAERDARRSEHAQLRREREELRASRAAERAGHEGTQTEAAPGEGAGGPPAPVLPPAGGRGAKCAISAETSAHEVTAGEAVTISGKLTCPALEEASRQNVTVYQHEFGAASSRATVVGTVTTANDGSYQFQSAGLKARSRFVVRAADAPPSPRVVIGVDAAITLQGPAPNGAALTMWDGHIARSANVADFSGTVQPQTADTAVALKVRYGGGAWHRFAVTHTDAQGRFSLSHRFRYAGAVSVVVVTRPAGDRRTTSAELSYTIVQAQNPALTIGQPATTPVSLVPTPGQAVTPEPTTVDGIAQPGCTVTLRALTSGHFAPVATTVSDAGGAYSFTVDPGKTTIYRVTCGKQRSTPLRVDAG